MRLLAFLGLCLLGCLLGGVHAQKCPLNSLNYEGQCFRYFPTLMNCTDAKEFCHLNFHGDLARIDCDNVPETVSAYLKKLGAPRDLWVQDLPQEASSPVTRFVATEEKCCSLDPHRRNVKTGPDANNPNAQPCILLPSETAFPFLCATDLQRHQ